MTLAEFADLVSRMRDAQVAFFRGARTRSQMQVAKDLERQVDRALDQYRRGRAGIDEQAPLFPS